MIFVFRFEFCGVDELDSNQIRVRFRNTTMASLNQLSLDQ